MGLFILSISIPQSSQPKNTRAASVARPPISQRSAWLAILCLAPVPTIGVYFAAFAGESAFGSLIWLLAKVVLFIGPVVIWFGLQRQPWQWPHFARQGLWLGLLSGIGLGAIIFASYWWIARPLMSFTELQQMLTSAGIDSIEKYLLLVAYLTLVNSLIEEYVFRWFFLTQLKRVVRPFWAVVMSALIFTLHHTVVLLAYVPWYFNLLASVGVFTGGLTWSYLYQRYQHLWPSYLSHIGADVGVFLIGYHSLFIAN